MSNEDPQSESELIRRFKIGDEDAFRTLFDGCQGELRARVDRLMSKAVQRRISVADVLQEARIVAFDRRRDLEDRGPGCFRNWLLGIVEMRVRETVRHNVTVNMRSIGREITRGHRPDTVACGGKVASPSEDAMGAELEKLTSQVMATLSDDYRYVLHLVCTERLTLDELAERMGRSKEAVRKLHKRAILKFMEVFNRLGGEGYE